MHGLDRPVRTKPRTQPHPAFKLRSPRDLRSRAGNGLARTVWGMSDRDLHARLIPTPLVSSFIGRSRPGDLGDTDPVRRAGAWASWAVEALAEFKGISDREYIGLILPGKFHDPRGNGPTIRPHLEIPARMFTQPDPCFPDRLAHAGNGLLFPWWVVSEVTALRRALFNVGDASPQPLIDALNHFHGNLADELTRRSALMLPLWSVIEGLLLIAPDGLVSDVCGDFTTAEIAAIFPPAAELSLTVNFDPKLRDSSGLWASRRVGVWQIAGLDPSTKKRFATGVVTPRLTANSVFKDPLFNPATEAPAAALVRLLLLNRLAQRHLSFSPAATVSSLRPDPSGSATGAPFLRAIPARVGQKLPEASVESAVHFLHAYADPTAAWDALTRWAGTQYLLTVTADAFTAAHTNALRYLRRAETPERDDINILLPLAWHDGRVARVTFSRPSE